MYYSSTPATTSGGYPTRPSQHQNINNTAANISMVANHNNHPTSTSPSSPRLQSAEASLALDQQALLAKMQRSLDELRSRYSAERKELLAAASEHVADARSEMDQTKQIASRCIQRVEAFKRQLRALESSAQNIAASLEPSNNFSSSSSASASVPSIRQNLSIGSERLVQALDSLREMTEQTQLLQSAILNDRVRRESRMRQSRDEDAELELRIRHLEESNAMLRAELAAVKAVNAESHKSIDKVLEICRPDATSAIHGSELKQVHTGVVRDLDHIKESLVLVQGRIESMETFSKREDERRNGMLEQLERVVREIETRPPPPSFTPKIQTKLLMESSADENNNNDGGRGIGGTYPSVVPRYRQPQSSSLNSNNNNNTHYNNNNSRSGSSSSDYYDNRDTNNNNLNNLDNAAAAKKKLANQLRQNNPNLSLHGPQTEGSAFQPAVGSPHGKIPPLRNRLMAFYSTYNPTKLSDVDRILQEYDGAEEELFSSLEVHYNAFGYFSNDLKFPQ